MRRFFITAVALLAVLSLGSANAFARSHHRSHRSRSHAHHARVRFQRFGAARTSTGPVTSTSETAGTVDSFAGGVLTIRLNDGTTVQGRVTDSTEVECQAMEAGEMFRGHEDSASNGGSDDNGAGDHGNGDGDGRGDGQDNEAQTCAASLLPGAVVREAELRVSSPGATWDKVELAG